MSDTSKRQSNLKSNILLKAQDIKLEEAIYETVNVSLLKEKTSFVRFL